MIPLMEWRDYAVEVLAEWLPGVADPMSDDEQYRVGLTSHENGKVVVSIASLDRNTDAREITFRILAEEDPLKLVAEAPPEKTPEQLEIEKLQAEVAQLNRQLGEVNAAHKAQLRKVREDAQASVKDAIAQLNLDNATNKRKEAEATAARSRTALVAKIAEHFAPLLAGFAYNFKDVRHVGELFDFLVFDGLEEGEIRKVVFLEVKSRKSGTRVTNPRERLLKKAIEEGRVSYEVYVPPVEVAKHDSDV